jgi:lipoate-protein ligase A
MERERWRLLDLEYDDPIKNLAIEEAILKAVGEGDSSTTMRFWRNLKRVVVIGRFQEASSEVDGAECLRHEVTVVRRFTGGGAVYHDKGNLNYAISISRKHPLVVNNPLASFKTLLGGIIKGLDFLGLSARYSPPGRIEVRNKKVSGVAGAMKWGGLLCHGTLLVHSNLGILSKVLRVTGEHKGGRYVQSKPAEVTTLRDQIGQDLSMQDVKSALLFGVGNTFRVRLIKGELSNLEKLYTSRFLKGVKNLI